MKPLETSRKAGTGRYSYTKVLDNSKRPVRGLWKRNGRFVARLAVEDAAGRKVTRWITLEAATMAKATEEMRTIHVERKENRMRHVGMTPKLADYVTTHLEKLQTSGLRPATVSKSRTNLRRWAEAIGHHHLDKVRPYHVNGHLTELRKRGLATRSVNIALMSLRGLFEDAKADGYVQNLPTHDIRWLKVDTKKRQLVTPADLNNLCEKALGVSKNGVQLRDYLLFMAYSGARRDETLQIRWADIDFDRNQLVIGAEGGSKNRQPRHVDLNANLRDHLREMHGRRAPDSQWLFPSPQRGDKDAPARTFMESLRLARMAADMPGFGFHDCRHLFISFSVMSGINFMVIARWVGHADGGILIGKTYGHLSNEHAQLQAQRLNFGPAVLQPQLATA